MSKETAKVWLDEKSIKDLFEAMPGGAEGFLKEFGYQQFAIAVESWVHLNNVFPDAQEKIDAQRYRFLRDPVLTDDFPPAHASCWVVEYSHPKGTIPELRSAGFGVKLDATIDLAMERARS